MEKYKQRLIKKLKSLTKDTKELIRFENIALSAFRDSDLSKFNSWMQSNEDFIAREFEKLCKDHNCVCQRCYVGPLQGNFWVTRSWKN